MYYFGYYCNQIYKNQNIYLIATMILMEKSRKKKTSLYSGKEKVVSEMCSLNLLPLQE